MSFKRGARNLNRELDLQKEEYSHISRGENILWRIYDGPTKKGPARGFVPERWGADCLPANIYQLSETHPAQFKTKREGKVRFLRFHTPHIKTYYLPEVWGVLAAPPEANPTHGTPVRLSKGNRSTIGAVPDGHKGVRSASSRIKRLKELRKQRGAEYPGPGETWVENIRTTPESFAYYPEGSASPLISAARELLNIRSDATRHAHKPSETYHESTRVNPLTEIRGSAADFPIPVNIPYLPDMVAFMSILASLRDYFDSHEVRNRHLREHTVFDVEVIDYAQLRRKQR